MTQQDKQEQRSVVNTTQHMMQATEDTVVATTRNIEALHTETDRARSILGFGRRILVPADEIHVVVGDGNHSVSANRERKVFGQAANKPSMYWLNPLTKVVKLKTISFTVPLIGAGGHGVEALDKSKVRFRLWAHAVAQLNPLKAETAAQRVGSDAEELVRNITYVATTELIAAAAQMSLEEVIRDRGLLAGEGERAGQDRSRRAWLRFVRPDRRTSRW